MGFSLCPHCETIGACQFGVIDQIVVDASNTKGRIHCPKHFEGLPGMAHGGWIAAVFDDIMGRHAWGLGAARIHTASLTVDFLKPVPSLSDLNYTVKSEPVRPGRWRLDAELRVAATDLLVAKAHGAFVEPKRREPEQYP